MPSTALRLVARAVIRAVALYAVGVVAASAVASLAPALAQRRTEVSLQQQQPWRGVVRARHQAALTTELTTAVSTVNVREGQRFRTGDLLVEFDCSRHLHELAALAALVTEAKVTHTSNDYLARRDASNRNDVAIAQARLLKATSEHAALAQRLKGCRVSAPFDGVVVELGVNAHEVPAPNRPLMTIVSDREFEVEIIVPSRVLSQLQAGVMLEFVADETRRRYRLSIVRTGGAVDPISQTAKVYASITTDHDDIVHGMSGTADPMAGRH